MAALTSLQKMGAEWSGISSSAEAHFYQHGVTFFCLKIGVPRVPEVDGILIILTSTLQFRGQKLGAVHSWAGTEPEISETNRLAARHGCDQNH